jgi:4-aminobutyrate aminotransferase-like enzyme
LCIGFDLQTSDLDTKCREDGLIIPDQLNGRQVLFPALDIEKKQIDEGVEIMRKHYQ